MQTLPAPTAFTPVWARRATAAQTYHAVVAADYTLADPVAEDRTCAVRVSSGRIVNLAQLHRMMDEQLDAIENGR